jgi:site-specific DNA-cytosine methylase
MDESEPWNVYENQQVRFTFNSITNCLGQGQRQQPGQGGVVVMYDAPFASFDAEYSGQFNITNDGQIAQTLKAKTTSAVGTGGVRTIVRRLTPLECERLMGWPDNYTAHGVSDEGELVDIANTNRYRICGNGIVATVTEWIGNRLPTVTGESDDETMTNSSNHSPAATSQT